MPITDYSGIEGFCVEIKSAQDVYDALDRMHTQLLDLIEPAEEYIRKREDEAFGYCARSEAEIKIERWKFSQRILEQAMGELLHLEGIKG